MEQIRYKQRNCTDLQKIEMFLSTARTGVLGMVSGVYPYAVPMNFVWYNGAVYIHGMGSGKKEDILAQQPTVCFTVYQEHGTVTDPVPCHADTAYFSVMMLGKAEKVTHSQEAATALQKFLDKFVPKYYSQSLTGNLIEKYRSSHDDKAVSVYRITPQQVTAKENSAQADQLFSSPQTLC